MYRVRIEAAHWLRSGVLSFAAFVSVVTTEQATARTHRAIDTGSPRYAACVVDVNSGALMRQANADSLRHPASLTKIMTLYMLFERLEAGRLKLNTPLLVSDEAASQAPSKLGLKPGQSILVEEAIKALVTKSANDAAVVVAEALAGDEDEFARQMTRKARSLGMSRTVYRNASGLPDDAQVTTARDQARLAMAIQERFPRYYRYFSLASFSYRGETIRNHNKLLGKVSGVDGIKTGYTRASGFNLVTSVRRGARHIIAVVLGGDTASQRDTHMRGLIDRYIVEASVKQPNARMAQAPVRTEPRIEARPETRIETPTQARAESPVESRPEPKPAPRITIVPIVPAPSEKSDATVQTPAPAQGSSTPINPTVVKAVPIKAASAPMIDTQYSAYAPAPELAPAIAGIGPLKSPTEQEQARPDEGSNGETVTGNISAARTSKEQPAKTNQEAQSQGNWIIQVGAFDQEDEAKQRLSLAKSKAGSLLSNANPYTERTTKGDKTIFRARFTGLDRAQAEAVCKILKQSDVACLALKI